VVFWKRSVRTRLTLWYTLVLLSTLLLFGALSYYFTGNTLSKNLDTSLQTEVRWLREFIGPQAAKIKPGKRAIDMLIAKKARPTPTQIRTAEDSTEEESDQIWNQIFRHTLQSTKKTYIQFTNQRGMIYYRSYSLGTDSLTIPDSIGLNATVLTTVDFNGEPVRIAATRDRNFTYAIGYPLADLRELLDNLFVIFIILLPIALAASVIGGLALSKTSLQPVNEVTTRALRITAENLDQTIPVRNANDEIGRLTVTINDMIQRLRDSFARVRQFSADASHELRTPLTIMRGEIELALRSTKTPDEYRRVLESSLEEILRLTSIIDNLLTLAKADRGQFETNFSEVDLKQLVEELFEDSEILAENKQITVSLRLLDPVTIVGDRVRLRQLFLNLIDNAIKYTPSGGSVTIAVERADGDVVFEVADTGIGIPPEEVGKIFDRFYRVDKARSREMGGTGLGLSIAKWIAEIHRGTIIVKSEPQKGSTFTVKLPMN
jgi:heavy metal sensor kinase